VDSGSRNSKPKLKLLSPLTGFVSLGGCTYVVASVRVLVHAKGDTAFY
jgi:hypothetical protein